MNDALRLAHWLERDGATCQQHIAAAAELSRLYDLHGKANALCRIRAERIKELEEQLNRKSDAIQRLWKERDELQSECRTLVRQNGEWQALNNELQEKLEKVNDQR